MADLLPPNASPLERTVATVAARIGDIDVPIDRLFDPLRCPAAVLPWLAWRHHVDRWNSAWPEAIKRAVIAAAPKVHARKGTPYAVETALAALGCPTALREWYELEPEGVPGTFEVDLVVNGAALPFDEEFFADALASINAAKNTRSHFAMRAAARLDAGLGLANVALPRQRHKVTLAPAGGMRAGLSLAAASAAANVSHAIMVVQ